MLSDWMLASLGNAKGTAIVNGVETPVAPYVSHRVEVNDSLAIAANSGKFADSEDSFIYCYRTIDPSADHFYLSAVVAASETETKADQQSGFGIMVADTDASKDKGCRHRNQLLLGRFGRTGSLGVRLVSGYADSRAFEQSSSRIVDESRVFSIQTDRVIDGSTRVLSVEKTDEGLTATCDGQSISIPGCDFLMRQDPSSLCVGFAVARGVRMEMRDINFRVTPGTASHTPEGTIQSHVPDYPFERYLLEEARMRDVASEGDLPQTCFVAPTGKPEAAGSKDDPTTIERALRMARPSTRIVLRDGTYRPTHPLIIASSGTIDEPITLEAEHPRQVCIDGSLLASGQPLLVLDADFWHLSGLVMRNSPLSGLTVLGSVNRISNCEAYANGDTGILVISRPGAERRDWPQHNMVKDCDSHHNCDAYRCNADGFGAKLRVGRGNVFYRCVAHHNIDDGFDLYTKSIFGPIEPVELDSCVAYGNGMMRDGGRDRTKPGGVGFKLGGERQAVSHEVWNCLAVGNMDWGFAANSNPLGNLHFCTAAVNGKTRKDNVTLPATDESRWVQEGVLVIERDLSYSRLDDVVRRESDGCLVANPTFAPKTRHGKRRGASLGMRKSVLLFISSISGGGAERVACALANKLCERYNVYLLYLGKKDEECYPVDARVTKISAEGIKWHPLPTRVGTRIAVRLLSLRRLLLLLRTRSRFNIDTTISFLETPNFLNALGFGGHRIVCERNDPSQKEGLYRKKSLRSCELADYVVFQTEKVKAMFPRSVQEKSCIIHNPVAVTCQAGPSRKKIVAAGRLHPQKNYPLLIRSFARFSKSHPEHTLHIFGQGKELGALRELAHDLGVENSVVFEGFSTDVHAAISDAEMFVLSSDYEGMSNALIEAMMMGLPCISTACTGSDELIDDGVDGLLVPVGDEAALAEAMGRLADDPSLRSSLAGGARMRSLDFALENVIRAWERIL